MKKTIKIMIVVLIVAIVTVFSYLNTKTNDNYLVRMAIHPVGSDSDTYFFELENNGNLEVTYGTKKNSNLKSGSFMPDDFIKKNKMLTAKDLDKIEELIKEVNSYGEITADDVDGGRQIDILIGERKYSYLGIDDSIEKKYPAIFKLVKELTILSPVKVKPNQRY